jgi:protein tyrosine phosphatase
VRCRRLTSARAPRRFIVVKACEDRALDPCTRTIAYFETEAEARLGVVNPKGFVVLTEDATIVNPFDEDASFGLTLGPSLAAVPTARFFQIQVAHADAEAALIDFCAPSKVDAARWLLGLRSGVAELCDSSASTSSRSSAVLAPAEEQLPRGERMRLLIRRSYDKLKCTSMLGKLVKNGSLELVRGGDALVQGGRVISLSGSQRLSVSTGGALTHSSTDSAGTADGLPLSQSRRLPVVVHGDDADMSSPPPASSAALTANPLRKESKGDAAFHSLQLDRLSPRHVGDTIFYLRVHIKRLFADADLSDADLPVWARTDHFGGGLGALPPPPLRTGFDLEFAYITHQSKSLYGYGDFAAANAPTNFAKNRYMDVMPPDRTRVVLHVSTAATAATAGRARMQRASSDAAAGNGDDSNDDDSSNGSSSSSSNNNNNDDDDSSSSSADGSRSSHTDSENDAAAAGGHVLRASRRDIDNNSSDADEPATMNGRDAEDSSGNYINASYIDGEWAGGARAYIAAQGPKEGTIHDFWRMVWQVNSNVIVMLTREYEAGRCKCSHYWPNPTASINSGGDGDPLLMFPSVDAAGSFASASPWRKYGEVEVRCFYEILSNEVVVRRFRLRRRRGADRGGAVPITVTSEPSIPLLDDEDSNAHEYRDVMHFQYVAWPDHGLPLNTRAFLELVRCVESLRGSSAVILHCSAGIGRTGTFFTVHNTVRRYHEQLLADSSHSLPPPINIVQTVLAARRQRPGMVQTREQFMFCYIAIEQWLDEALNALSSVRRTESASEFENLLRSTSPATARSQAAASAVQANARKQLLASQHLLMQQQQQQQQRAEQQRLQNERIIAKQRQLRLAVPAEVAATDLNTSWRSTSYEAMSPMNEHNGAEDMATDDDATQ